MATAPESANPTALNQETYDDLTQISGIKNGYQRILREEFGVRTYQDLASLPPDEVARLKKRVGGLHRDNVDGWIAEARGLVSGTQSSAQPPSEPKDASPGAEESLPAHAGEWHQTDVFIVLREALEVEGQVEDERYLVEHIEAEDGDWIDNRTEEREPVEPEEFASWMADRIRRKLVTASKPESAVSAKEQPLASGTPESPGIEIQVTNIRAFQPPDSRIPVWKCQDIKNVEGFIKGDEAFTLKMCLDLAGADRASMAAERRAYYVRLYARPISGSGGTIDLGNTEIKHLVEGQFTYQADLLEAALPPGLYSLRLLAQVRGKPPIMRSVDVPVLQVAASF